MIAVRVMQASVDQIINMIPMGNSLMTAARTMPMRLVMSGSPMLWIAPIRIRRANFNHVLFNAPFFKIFQMTVVEIIDVVLMLNGNMAAAWTVHMRLIGGGHGSSFRACCVLAVCPQQRMIDGVSDGIEDTWDTLSWHLDASATCLFLEPNFSISVT